MSDDVNSTSEDATLDPAEREALAELEREVGGAEDSGARVSAASTDAQTQGPPSKLLGVLALFAIALMGVGALFAIRHFGDTTPPERAASIGAKLELAAGEVVLVTDEGDGEPLISGTPLPLGAKLRTGAGARALIRLSDGSRVFLNESTTVAIGEDTGVSVLTGEIWLDAPPLDEGRDPLEHRVGPATLALSEGGASLSLDDGSGGATIYVAKGVATVTGPGGPKEVRSGEQAKVGDAGAPEVSPVPFWDDWTGGLAERSAGGRIGGGSGSLYAVDRYAPPGTPALPLQISSQIVDVAIDHGLAETRVDQRFFNPSDRDVEGWYWFTVPEGATLVGFELETNGELVKGEIVEKKQAVATYERAVVSNDNPALLEWIDERTVRARIYPVPAMGERRVVVRYQQLLAEAGGKLRYSYPLAGGGGRDAVTIEEFSLAVELRGDLGAGYTISTLDEATVSNDDALVTMRRTGFTPRADFELELTRKQEGEETSFAPLRLSQYEGGPDQARFIMLRWLPDLDFAELPTPRADVVVVVDTSAFGDDAEHLSRVAVAEALLRSLSSEDHFALMAADLTAEVLYPAKELSPATPEAIDEALETLKSHRPGGATDLGAIFERALTRVHSAEQPAIVYVGDGLATSGERSADALAERLRRALSGSRARLFTVGVGPDVDDRLLARLARVGGGDSLRVEQPEEAVVRALELSGALKTPTITELELDLGEGLDDRFDNVTGKLARGQELVILARTHHELPEEITVRGRLGGEGFEKPYAVTRQQGPLDHVVPKLWAAARIERLLGDGRGPDAVRGKVLALGLEYGLMTPFTSFLALESESAYRRQGVERRRRPWDFQLLGAVLPSQWRVEPERRDPFAPDEGVSAGELLIGAVTAPLGCSAAPGDSMAAREEAPPMSAAADMDDDEAGGPGQRHKGEEGRMGRPTSEPNKQGLYAMDGKDAIAQAGEAEPEEPMAMEEEADFDAPAMAAPKPTAALSGSGYGGGGTGSRRANRAKRDSGGDDGGSGDPFADGLVDELPPAPPPEPDPEPAADSAAFIDDLAEADKGGFGVGGPGGSAREQSEGLSVDELLEKAPDDKPARQRRQKPRPSTVVSPVARDEKKPCSDASARSLAQRKVLWEQRLDRAPDMVARLRAYETAAASCELENWNQQRVFLQLLAAGADTEAEIELLLAHFRPEAEAQSFVSRALLRRLVEPGLIGAVERGTYGGSLDWVEVQDRADRATTASAALELVEEALAKHADASEDERLPLELSRIDLLFELDRTADAIASARTLRQRGLITPLLAQRLGELLVEAGEEEEAKRVFSEIVEYDPGGEYTRRLLGDIFLRHGWYQEAYRQYQDLVSLTHAPLDQIRMARAAAGSGRVDEGLRILRKVAAGEGRPGMDDPRRFARLHAAVLLAQMLATDESLPRDKLERELDRLQLFDVGTTWTFVVWTDLEHQLTLGVDPLPADATPAERTAAQAAALRVSEGRGAGDTGLWAIQTGGLDDLVVRHRGEVPTREVGFERISISWDSERFEVKRELGTIAARAAREEPPKAEPEPE